MILVAVLLCTLLRGVRMQENKIAAITLLTHAARHCDDDTRLQRVVPYLLVRRLFLPVTSLRHATFLWLCVETIIQYICSRMDVMYQHAATCFDSNNPDLVIIQVTK